MPLVNTKALLGLLRQRGGPLDNAAFIDSYAAFVRDCLAGRQSYDQGPYFDWIVRKLEIQGRYMDIFSAAGIPKRLREDRSLILDIGLNGIREPIRLTRDEFGLEIDGWHRVVIADVLGFVDVSCEAAPGFCWPLELA